MVIDRFEHLFRRDQKMRHLPHRHFKVHLGELEQPVYEICQKHIRPYDTWVQSPFEESRHPDVRATPVRGRAELSAILTGDGDSRTAHRTGPDRSNKGQ